MDWKVTARELAWRGRVYIPGNRRDALLLATQLGIRGQVARLHATGAPSLEIARVLWEAVLAPGRRVTAGGAS